MRFTLFSASYKALLVIWKVYLLSFYLISFSLIQWQWRRAWELSLKAGLAAELEIAQNQIQLANAQAQLPVYQEASVLASHALALLLAQAPGKLAYLLDQPSQLPVAVDLVKVDLPSTLLQPRPDIRRAERQLAAANAQIGVATAAKYSRFNLTAFLGLQNLNLKEFTPIGQSWAANSSTTLPLFNWGSISANIDSKSAQYEQVLLAYQTTVLTAFKEVEDALVSYQKQQQRKTALQASVNASQLAVTLSKELYGKGLMTYLDVLTAERVLYQNQINLLLSDTQLLTQQVSLYKALGGGILLDTHSKSFDYGKNWWHNHLTF